MSEDRQRVNIQVSVRLDKLEQEVQQMLIRAQQIVGEVPVDSLPTTSDPFNEDTFNRIHNIRMDLADADAALQDASNSKLKRQMCHSNLHKNTIYKSPMLASWQTMTFYLNWKKSFLPFVDS